MQTKGHENKRTFKIASLMLFLHFSYFFSYSTFRTIDIGETRVLLLKSFLTRTDSPISLHNGGSDNGGFSRSRMSINDAICNRVRFVSNKTVSKLRVTSIRIITVQIGNTFPDVVFHVSEWKSMHLPCAQR